MQGLEKLQLNAESTDSSHNSRTNNLKYNPLAMSKAKIERPGLVPNLFPGPSTRRRRSPRNIKCCNGTTIATPTSTLQSTSKSNASNNTETILNNILLDDLEPLENQVAGHMYDVDGKLVGMLKHKDDFVLKPITKQLLGEREIRFYEDLQTSVDPLMQELKAVVPGYHGTKTIHVNGQDVKCIVLDNLTKGFKEPCIMDIKIGRRTWDPLATPEKIQNETNKYGDCKRDVGFCIPGFQVRNIIDGKLYKYGKDYGRHLNRATIKDALKIFLNADAGLSRTLLVQFLGSLWRILHWCRKQKKLRIYSSSLLLVYDARLLRHYLKTKPNDAIKLPFTEQVNNNKHKRNNRPPSLAVTDTNNTALLSAGFSGQFTSDGPKFERSLSTTSAAVTTNATSLSTTSGSSANNNCPWKKSLKKLQRTHSFSHNYEEDLQNLKQNYVYMLDDLVDDSTNLWANVKMIDFAHVFPAEGNTLDSNYLEGVENLVKIFESLLQEIS